MAIKKALVTPSLWIVLFSLQFPSLRVWFKYIPESLHLLVVPYLVLMFLFYAVTFESPLLAMISQLFLRNKMLYAAVFVAVTIIMIVGYAVADSRKLEDAGSDQDDALILAGQQLSAGHYPYAHKTYLNNPISPGPGWVILFLPVTVLGIYPLVIPGCVFGIAYLIYRLTESVTKSNLFLWLLFSSPLFWETTFQGSDLLPLGCGFVLGSLLLYFLWGKNIYWDFAISLFIAFMLTSRIILAGYVFIWACFLKQRLRFGAVVGLLVIASHGLFWVWNPSLYSPLHVIDKGQTIFTVYHLIAALLISGIAVVYALLNLQTTLESWLYALWMCIFVPLGLVSLAQLRAVHYDFARWEGATYQMIAIPVYLFYLSLVIFSRQPNRDFSAS